MTPKSNRLDIYARGGEVITSRSRFMKSADPFRTDTERNGYGKTGKGGAMSKMKGDKSTPLPKRGSRK